MLCSFTKEQLPKNNSNNNINNINNNNNNKNNMLRVVQSKVKNHCLREMKANSLKEEKEEDALYPLQRFCHDVLKFVEIEGVELSDISKQLLQEYSQDQFSDNLISLADMDLFFASLESSSIIADENDSESRKNSPGKVYSSDGNNGNCDDDYDETVDNEIVDNDGTCIVGFGIKSSPTREILGQSSFDQNQIVQSPSYDSQFSPISEYELPKKTLLLNVTPSRDSTILNETISHLERELQEERDKNADYMEDMKKLRKENSCLSQVNEGLEEECIKLMQINKLQEEEIKSLRSKIKAEVKSVEIEKNDSYTQTEELPFDVEDEENFSETTEQILSKADDNLDLLHDSTLSVMNVRDKLLKIINHNNQSTSPKATLPSTQNTKTSSIQESVNDSSMSLFKCNSENFENFNSDNFYSGNTPSGKTADTSIVSMSEVLDEQINIRDNQILKLKDIIAIQQEMIDRKKSSQDLGSKYYASMGIQCEMITDTFPLKNDNNKKRSIDRKKNALSVWGEFNFAFYSLFMWLLGLVLAVMVLKIESRSGELWNRNLVLIG